MPPDILDYAPRTEFDTGRFVARYLQVWAFLSIALMIAGPVFFNSFYLDLSPIFLFWAASALNRRSRTARGWVLVLTGLTLGVTILTVAYAAIGGTQNITISLGANRIKNPALWQVAAVAIPFGLLVGVPFGVLMSERARRQFHERPVER